MAPRAWSLRTSVGATVVALLVLLVASAATTAVSRGAVRDSQTTMRRQLLPMMTAVDDLALAFADQEAGQRGYLLSGDRVFLAPYRAGALAERTAVQRLETLMGNDIRGGLLIDAVEGGARTWRAEVGEPTRVSGPTAQERTPAALERSRRLFDEVRRDLVTLRAYVSGLVAGQFHRIDLAQRVADITSLVALVLAGVVAAVSVVILRRRLGGPLDDLVEAVDRVAAGERDTPLVAAGPQELRRISAAVESMRVSMLESTATSVAQQRLLALRDERDRMAADLHDHTVQRVFALSLALSAEMSRDPSLAAALEPLVKETDEIIRELRTMIFGIRRDSRVEGLHTQVEHLVADSARALGFTPTLLVEGPLDTVTDEALAGAVLGVVREALSNVARHSEAEAATVSLVVDGQELTVTVADDGGGCPANGAPIGHGLVNLRERAEALAGTCELGSGPAGTTLTWRVPWS